MPTRCASPARAAAVKQIPLGHFPFSTCASISSRKCFNTDCTGAGTSGCVVARNADGTLTKADVTGGPSGIVVDNYSTAAQASSIYFSGATAPNLAYKFTQNGLQ